jgi:hypothetical protein
MKQTDKAKYQAKKVILNSDGPAGVHARAVRKENHARNNRKSEKVERVKTIRIKEGAR